jgi:hypothetical protein
MESISDNSLTPTAKFLKGMQIQHVIISFDGAFVGYNKFEKKLEDHWLIKQYTDKHRSDLAKFISKYVNDTVINFVNALFLEGISVSVITEKTVSRNGTIQNGSFVFDSIELVRSVLESLFGKEMSEKMLVASGKNAISRTVKEYGVSNNETLLIDTNRNSIMKAKDSKMHVFFVYDSNQGLEL